MRCEHKNCSFHGMYSLVGTYKCDDCGFEIEPVIYHYINGMPHMYHEQIGHSSNWDNNKTALNHCLEKFWEAMSKSGYQPPHWDHEPTEAELEQEEKWEAECENYSWLKDWYVRLIFILLNSAIDEPIYKIPTESVVK